mmetsp:Transcript_15984/g.39797  ORF Transcript_15984/g.39797 Transcript_15984/m.39797 type:complete len:340 (+) Transcript_15984:258-1277(+)
MASLAQQQGHTGNQAGSRAPHTGSRQQRPLLTGSSPQPARVSTGSQLQLPHLPASMGHRPMVLRHRQAMGSRQLSSPPQVLLLTVLRPLRLSPATNQAATPSTEQPTSSSNSRELRLRLLQGNRCKPGQRRLAPPARLPALPPRLACPCSSCKRTTTSTRRCTRRPHRHSRSSRAPRTSDAASVCCDWWQRAHSAVRCVPVARSSGLCPGMMDGPWERMWVTKRNEAGKATQPSEAAVTHSMLVRFYTNACTTWSPALWNPSKPLTLAKKGGCQLVPTGHADKRRGAHTVTRNECERGHAWQQLNTITQRQPEATRVAAVIGIEREVVGCTSCELIIGI